MDYTSIYCEAEHPNSPLGCYELTGHNGQHRGVGILGAGFYWDAEPEPTPTTEPLFTNAELSMLSMLLEPVKQFFPELSAKVEAQRTS